MQDSGSIARRSGSGIFTLDVPKLLLSHTLSIVEQHAATSNLLEEPCLIDGEGKLL